MLDLMMVLPVSMSRSSSQPFPVSHYAKQFPDQGRSYCYCSGPTQRHEHHQYYPEVPPPTLIKLEPNFSTQGYHQPVHRSDWPTTATSPMAQQPMKGSARRSSHRRADNQAAGALHGLPAPPGFHVESTYGSDFAVLRTKSTARTTSAAPLQLQPQSQSRLPNQDKREPDDTSELQTRPEAAVTYYESHRHRHNIPYSVIPTSSQVQPLPPGYFEDPNTDPMSLTYEQRFMTDANYPSMGMAEQEEMQNDNTRYPSPPMPTADMAQYHPRIVEVTDEDVIESLPIMQAMIADAPSPGRSKPIPKPNREVTKTQNGRFICTWIGCTEEVRDFQRKCEWSKHMDKHDRPYKCPAEGCEKLPGFTYSGGLLRHEREVHGKHGGPKKQLNCPHPNCKRHEGKGFSRQENLNEHLRRVHTTDGVVPDGAETEEEGSDAKAGLKRKRGSTRGEDDIRQELKRLRAENDELRKHSEAQSAQTAEMMNQIRQLQSAVTVQHSRNV